MAPERELQVGTGAAPDHQPRRRRVHGARIQSLLCYHMNPLWPPPEHGGLLLAEDIQRLQAEEIRVLGSSSTGFDPRQLAPSGAPQQQTQQLQQQHQHSAADANVQQSASNPAPLFTWNLNQPQQQQQQQPAVPLAIPAGGAYHAQAPPSSDFSFGAGSSNGTFVFGQSPTYLGHASAGNMTS